MSEVEDEQKSGTSAVMQPSALRGVHEQLVAWARQALAQGRLLHEVVREIYGVNLPKEAYIFHRHRPRNPELPLERTYFPWRLLELAQPKYVDDAVSPWAQEQEANALAQDPDFLPLMKLEAFEAKHDGFVIGYSLRELLDGRTTILGHDEDIPPSGATFTVLGDSLLSVLHEWAADHLRMTDERYHHPSNRGAGSLDAKDVDRARCILRAVEHMQNFLAWELRVERLRRAVLAALEEARDAFEQALQPGQPNYFTWHGEMFWVDRVRRFVVPVEASEIRDDAWASRDTLVEDDDDTKDTLDIYAGDSQLEDTGAFLGMWARVITGATSRGLWQITGAKFINLAIAQTKINPAFGPLFWLFLADDMGAGTLWDYADNLFKRVGPMIYQLIDYPRLTQSPEEVRRAQIDFLEGLFPGTTDASCAKLSDVEWAARCEEQLRRYQRLVDGRFFSPVLEKIGSLGEPDARKFE